MKRLTIAILVLAMCVHGATTPRLRMAVKIGTPSSRPDGFKEGYVSSWSKVAYDSTGAQVSGARTFGRVGSRAYLAVDVPDTPENRDSVRLYVQSVGDDSITVRARCRIFDIDSLAARYLGSATGAAAQADAWRATDTALPVVYTEDWGGLARDAASVPDSALPVVGDRWAISAGTYYIGSDTADDYSSWADGANDIASAQTGDLSLIGARAEVLTETSSASFTDSLKGFELRLTVANGQWHNGAPGSGHFVDVDVANHLFFIGPKGPGRVVVERIGARRVSYVGNSLKATVPLAPSDIPYDATVRNIMSVGGWSSGWQSAGVIIANGVIGAEVYGNNMIGHWRGMYDHGTGSRFENNSVTGAVRGFDANSVAGVYIRNVAINTTDDFLLVGSATGYSNASEDATAADANWGTGASNITGITAAAFVSLDTTRSDFFRPTYTGALANPDSTTRLDSNTTDLSGRAWSTYGDWIGALAGVPSTVDSISPTYGNKRSAVSIYGEGFHASQGTGTALIGSDSLLTYTYWSDTLITGTITQDVTNVFDVIVTNDSGVSDTLADAFTFLLSSQVTIGGTNLHTTINGVAPGASDTTTTGNTIGVNGSGVGAITINGAR